MRESAPSGFDTGPDVAYALETMRRNQLALLEWFSPLHAPQRILEMWTMALESQGEILRAFSKNTRRSNFVPSIARLEREGSLIE